MPAAAQIRTEIEAALGQRIPSALTPPPKIVRPTVATGIGSLDELLGGGLPVGAISEIVGRECSGRTTMALSFLAQITRRGHVCAWVDVSDTLHPPSAAAAGIDLDRLLWVRCGGTAAPVAKLDRDWRLSVEAPKTSRVHLGGNSPHPRTESKGLPAAIDSLLGANAKYKRDKIVGTPGAPNRPLEINRSGVTTPAQHEEQIASDRMPARRGAYVLEQRESYEPRCAEPQTKPRLKVKQYDPVTFGNRDCPVRSYGSRKAWSRLDEALRVTDLLLQTGGFSAVVLDMGGIAAEFASRIPLATWFRYRAAAERTQLSFLMLTQHPCAKSSAGIVLSFDDPQPLEAGTKVFAGFKAHAGLSRRRFEPETVNVFPIKRPPHRTESAEWRSRTAWTGR